MPQTIELSPNHSITIPDDAVLNPPPEPTFVISKLAFKQRLTQAERIAIRTAAQSNPVVYDFLDIMDSATFIDLQRQDTIDGLTAMEAAGLLAEGRANEILTTPAAEHEVFRG